MVPSEEYRQELIEIAASRRLRKAREVREAHAQMLGDTRFAEVQNIHRMMGTGYRDEVPSFRNIRSTKRTIKSAFVRLAQEAEEAGMNFTDVDDPEQLGLLLDWVVRREEELYEEERRADRARGWGARQFYPHWILSDLRALRELRQRNAASMRRKRAKKAGRPVTPAATSCVECGAAITSKRAGAKFCSPACRQREYRLRQS